MQTVQGNRIESLRAVLDFVAEHTDRLPLVARSGTFRSLTAAVAQVTLLSEQQAASRGAGQGETQLVHAARDALLLDHLTPIVGCRTSFASTCAASGSTAVRRDARGRLGP
jgi:hypothetical protein